jgi:signal transduction histidine kinase
MKKRSSLFFRTLALSAGLTLGSLALIGLAFSGISYRYVVSQRRATLDSTAAVIADVASAFATESELGDWQLSIILASTSRATGAHVSVCGEDGAVASTSDYDFYSGKIGFAMPEEIIGALYVNGYWSGLSDLGGYYEHKRWVSAAAIREPYGGSVLGYVFAAAERGDIGGIWKSYALIFLIAAGIALAAAMPASVLLSRRQAAPLAEMAEAARSFARGDLSVRVKSSGRRDETGELAEAFNLMAEAMEKAEQSRRDFVSNVSHELKTPMTAIAGYAEGLLDGTIPMKDAEKYLAVIADETHRLSRLVRRMLELSRMREADLKEGSFELCEAVTRALLSLEARIGDRRLEVDLRLNENERGETEPLRVRGDMDSVSQVIYNILDNAVKFAREGTELSVRVWRQDKKAYVSVRDRGETIPEEDLPHIFERFHKSDRSRSLDRDGVGLGLHIVKTIIDRLGEDIWVRSRDGETEFVFSLTLAPPERKAGPEVHSS